MTPKTAKSTSPKPPLSYALEITEKLNYPYDKAQAFSLIAGKLLMHGRNDEAVNILEKAVESASNITNESLRVIVLSEIAGNFREAEMEKRADTILNVAVESSASIEDALPRVKALIGVAEAYWKAGLYDEEYETLHRALNDSLEIPDDGAKANLMSEIALKYLAVGEFNMAQQIARSIELAYWRALTLAKIGGRIIDAGQDNVGTTVLIEARNLTDSMNHPNARAEALAEIAGCHLEGGRNEKALELLAEALKFTEAVSDDFIKAGALAQVAAMYGIAGKSDDAMELFSQALSLSYKTELEYLRIFFLAKVVNKFALAGMFDKAVETLIQAIHEIKNHPDSRIKAAALKEAVKSYRGLVGRVQSTEVLNAFLEAVKTLEDANLGVWALTKVAVDYAVHGTVFDEGAEKVMGLMAEFAEGTDKSGE